MGRFSIVRSSGCLGGNRVGSAGQGDVSHDNRRETAAVHVSDPEIVVLHKTV